MPAVLNKVFILGNLTQDPELRLTGTGKSVGNMNVAMNTSYKSGTGETKTTTCFVNVIVWGKQAESCEQYLHKGSPILIEGRLQLDQWKDKDGGKRSMLKVVGERIQFLTGSGTRDEPGEDERDKQEQATLPIASDERSVSPNTNFREPPSPDTDGSDNLPLGEGPEGDVDGGNEILDDDPF